MAAGIRLVAQYYDKSRDEVLEEILIREDNIEKVKSLKELGYLHIEQIDILQKVQDFKIKQQLNASQIKKCPKCGYKTKKQGVFTSRFHAALTDHRASIQRTSCKCGWRSSTSIEGMYGSTIHPDLLKKQAIQGAQNSYHKASDTLNAESANTRAINSHSQIYKTVKMVANPLEQIRKTELLSNEKVAKSIIANIDGGHVKAKGENRSFEAMIVTTYRPENLKYVDKNHNKITSKTTVASARDDEQSTVKALFRSACLIQGMSKETEVICLADGAENCKSIAYSVKNECASLIYILDWFHVAKKFQNISIPEEHRESLNKAKWHLWHGNPDQSLKTLKSLRAKIKEQSLKIKLTKLATYIGNNKDGIVNYSERKNRNLVYTSTLAESTVNTLINERQKGQKKMQWSRDGAHNILQIRASINSKLFDQDWEKVEAQLYKKVA
jgi:hypothetical protein